MSDVAHKCDEAGRNFPKRRTSLGQGLGLSDTVGQVRVVGHYDSLGVLCVGCSREPKLSSRPSIVGRRSPSIITTPLVD